MAIELVVGLMLISFCVGMFFSKYLGKPYTSASAVTLLYGDLHRRVESIAMDLKILHGLKRKYIVTRVLNSNRFVWVEVKEFLHDCAILNDGSCHSYISFSGYCMPPASIVEQMKVHEAGLQPTKQIIPAN